MSITERWQPDELLNIADEDDTPMSAWEVTFVQSLDVKRPLSLKQAECFDRIVDKHLRDNE